MKNIGTFDLEAWGQKYKNMCIVLTGRKYQDGTPVVVVNCEDGERFAELTCCVGVGPNLPINHFMVKTWSENKELANALRNGDVFRDTGVRVPTGFVEAEVWRLRNGN